MGTNHKGEHGDTSPTHFELMRLGPRYPKRHEYCSIRQLPSLTALEHFYILSHMELMFKSLIEDMNFEFDGARILFGCLY